MSIPTTTPVSTTGTTVPKDLIFKLLAKLKDTLKEVFSFDDSSLSSMVVSGTLMPLVTQMMSDPLIRDAIISDVITDDIKKAIESLDSFKLTRTVKDNIGKSMFSNTQQYHNSSFKS